LPLGVREFLIQKKVVDDGESLEEEDDDAWFKTARAGDHLLTPFQCNVCHFRNIMLRDPDLSSATNFKMLDFIMRAIIDSFWSRESSTVYLNLCEAVRSEKTKKHFGMPYVTKPMGPWPLEDNLGMKVAIVLLDWSLDKGVYEETVQWDTFRCSMSSMTNISQAGVGGLKESVGAYERNRMFILDVVTHKFWYSCFMTGVHK
jgi:hypothetical protein